jgi:hypothetical protein
LGLKPSWLPENQWADLLEASKGVNSLKDLLGHFLANRELWKTFHASTDPSVDIPKDWGHLRQVFIKNI